MCCHCVAKTSQACAETAALTASSGPGIWKKPRGTENRRGSTKHGKEQKGRSVGGSGGGEMEEEGWGKEGRGICRPVSVESASRLQTACRKTHTHTSRYSSSRFALSNVGGHSLAMSVRSHKDTHQTSNTHQTRIAWQRTFAKKSLNCDSLALLFAYPNAMFCFHRIFHLRFSYSLSHTPHLLPEHHLSWTPTPWESFFLSLTIIKGCTCECLSIHLQLKIETSCR